MHMEEYEKCKISQAVQSICTSDCCIPCEFCNEKGIKEVVYDRGGFIYQGKVAALAEAAREAGLVF